MNAKSPGSQGENVCQQDFDDATDVLSKVDRARYDIKLIDADQNKQAVHDLGVTIIPTVIVYRGGQEVARLPNMMSLDQLP